MNKILIHATTGDKSWKHAKWQKPVTKNHILCDSIFMKNLEEANPYRQKVNEWLPRAGVRGVWGG